MKTNIFKSAALALVAMFFATTFTACDKNEDEPTPSDLTKLTAMISECQTLLDGANTTDYPQEAIDAFKTVVDAAKTVTTASTQAQVDNMLKQLTEAKATFLASAYGAIDANDLLFGLTFEEGTGKQLTADGKGWTAVLNAGPADVFGTNTGIPTFVDGHKGKGKGMHFENGAFLQVDDYEANSLLGGKLSISLWAKPDSTRAGNYLLSFNYWNSWKFQLQDQNKPFFTAHTNSDGWCDADNESDFSAQNNEWTHLVVAIDIPAGKLTFYVNGVLSKEWTSETKTGLVGTGFFDYSPRQPLLIGTSALYAERGTGVEVPSTWDSFVGSMDEIKIYSTALTEGQVKKLYNDEK